MKNLFLVIIFLFASFYTAFSDDDENADKVIQETSGKKRQDIWLSLGADVSMYSTEGFSYGGSFAFGFGSGSSIGVKASYFFNEEGIDTLETCFLLRFYMLGRNSYSGPFLQFMGGVSLFNRSGNFAIPSNSGALSAGFCFGWRFLFADRWFLEPAVRGGYPYLFGGAISAGIRF